METKTNEFDFKNLITATDGLVKAISLHRAQTIFYSDLFNKLAEANPLAALNYSPMMKHYQEIAQWHAVCVLVAEKKLHNLQTIADAAILD